MNPQIKLLPGLNPAVFFKRKNVDFPFPLDAAHSYYYFERNAIWWGIKALGLQPGDEVLMPAYNSDTEEQVLEYAGLKLIYFDVNQDGSYYYSQIEKLVTPKTRALYLIHYFGFAQNLPAAKDFCNKHNLLLLEDCALSLFSKADDKDLGASGDVGFFCLRKYLQIPNGGSLVVNKKIRVEDRTAAPSWFSAWIETKGLMLNYLAKQSKLFVPLVTFFKFTIKHILNPFRTRSGEPKVEKDKFSWRMSGISGYLLQRLDYGYIIEKRKQNYSYLKQELAYLVDSSNKASFFGAKEQPGFVPFCFPLIVDDNKKWQKDLAKLGIESGAWWANDPRPQPKAQCENNVWLRRHLLEIPIHHDLTKKDLDYIINNIKGLIIK